MEPFYPDLGQEDVHDISADLTGGRQRIPSFIGDAQGIKPIGRIGREAEQNVGGGVGIVLVQADFGAQKVKAPMRWQECAVGMSWLVVNGKTRPISFGNEAQGIKKMGDRPSMDCEGRSRAFIRVPPGFKGSRCGNGRCRIL